MVMWLCGICRYVCVYMYDTFMSVMSLFGHCLLLPLGCDIRIFVYVFQFDFVLLFRNLSMFCVIVETGLLGLLLLIHVTVDT